MRVKLLVALHGASPGDEVDVAEDEAVRLFSARYAVPALPKMERAVIAPVETRKRKK